MAETHGHDGHAYTVLTGGEQADMARSAIHQLEEQLFEARLNLEMSDDGDNLELPIADGQGRVIGKERATSRITRLQRQLNRLQDRYGTLLAE